MSGSTDTAVNPESITVEYCILPFMAKHKVVLTNARPLFGHFLRLLRFNFAKPQYKVEIGAGWEVTGNDLVFRDIDGWEGLITLTTIVRPEDYLADENPGNPFLAENDQERKFLAYGLRVSPDICWCDVVEEKHAVGVVRGSIVELTLPPEAILEIKEQMRRRVALSLELPAMSTLDEVRTRILEVRRQSWVKELQLPERTSIAEIDDQLWQRHDGSTTADNDHQLFGRDIAKEIHCLFGFAWDDAVKAAEEKDSNTYCDWSRLTKGIRDD